MSTTAERRAADEMDLGHLDELSKSQALWKDRIARARALTVEIGGSTGPILVLHGPAQSGRTELMQRWVVPALRESFRVLCQDTSDALAGEIDPGSADLHIWDGFERCLPARDAAPGHVTDALRRFVRHGRARLVLILREDCLARLFPLGAEIPAILENIRPIFREELTRAFVPLPGIVERCGLTLTPAFVECLVRDLSTLRSGTPMHPELVAVVGFELCRTLPGGALDVEQHHALGGLTGILEGHLEFLLDKLPHRIDPRIGWAVLEELAAAEHGSPADLGDVAARFDVPEDVPAGVADWLRRDRRILRQRASGDYRFVHMELQATVQQRVRRESVHTSALLWSLRQGVMHYAGTEALLSEANFKRIHAQRSAIDVDEHEAQLMLRCALRYEGSPSSGMTEHWLRRVSDEEARTDILLEALFESDAFARQRAAAHLKRCARPEVRTTLHLLALRDPCDTVRAQAVDSLAPIKDEALCSSLIGEVEDAHSPYRLQAIEALRIFDDERAVAALVQLVSKDAPGEARTRALTVLARQDTTLAAGALLDIALNDPDAEDRSGAIAALASMRSPEAMRFALDRLERPDVHRQEEAPRHSAYYAVACAAGAAVASVATLVFHGLTIAVLGRPWLAMIVTGVQALGIMWMRTATPGRVLFGLALFLVTLTTGLLAPLRMLLSERRLGQPQGPFRSWAGVVLFAMASPTYFLILHGLPGLMTGRIRQSFALIGCQAAATITVVAGVFIERTYGAFAEVTPVFHNTALVLIQTGAIVWVATYAHGLLPALLDLFILRARRDAERKTDAVYTAILRNPVTSGVLVEQLGATERRVASQAMAIIRRFWKQMRRALEAAWPSADPKMRRRLYSLLARGNDADALRFMRSTAGSLGLRGRLRLVRTAIAMRFDVWPRGLLIILALILATALGVGYTAYEDGLFDPDELADTLEGSSVPARLEAVSQLRTLAEQKENAQLAHTAAVKLVAALDSPRTADSVEVRQAVIGAMPIVAVNFKPIDFVNALGSQLELQELQLPAIDALKKIGTPRAALRLRDFVESSVAASGGIKEEARAGRQSRIDIRQKAIAAISEMRDAGSEAVRMLDDFRKSPHLPATLRNAAATAITHMNPTTVAEYYAADEVGADDNYRKALEFARQAQLQGVPDRAAQLRIDAVFRKAYTHRVVDWLGKADRSYNAEAIESVKTDILQALKRVDRSTQEEMSDLALRIVYEFHEAASGQNAAGYEAAFDLLSVLEEKSRGSTYERSVEMNLAEASLTAGRYRTAYRRADALVKKAERGTPLEINMKFVKLAALVFLGDREAAARMRDDLTAACDRLPAGFDIDWTYVGTRNFIAQAPDLSDADRAELVGMLDRIDAYR